MTQSDESKLAEQVSRQAWQGRARNRQPSKVRTETPSMPPEELRGGASNPDDEGEVSAAEARAIADKIAKGGW